ncbi:MAG: hypothetical protein HY894_06275 [Deltaproteobacteria bacterium]|nr:hypothetical protein [Deltaproteobacteria bacterium]
MKIYKLPLLAEAQDNGVYRLGSEELHTDGVDLAYGRLRPKEAARPVAIAPGREGVVCVIKGRISVKCGRSVFAVSTGEAFHAAPGASFTFENPGEAEAVYLIAGGQAGARRQEAAAASPQKTVQGETTAPCEETVYDITRDDTDTVD